MGPHPQLYSPYDGPMWDSIAAGRMSLQRCAQCGAFRYPPSPCCSECLSVEFSWELISGEGNVLSWTTFHRQYLPAYPPPTTVIAVKLAEGPILISNIDSDATPRLKLDAPVVLIYGTHPDGYALPRFRLAGQPAR